MKPDIKERWIKALRSGEYKQTAGRLDRNGSYCCLGVLCELLKDESPYFTKTSIENGKICYGDSWSTLNAEQLDYADIDIAASDILIKMNDTFVKSFYEIADYIEDNL
jgi:hypothetical protein